MLLLRKPTADALKQYVASQSSSDFSYSAVGASAGKPPSGFTVDHTRIQIGAGEPTFHAAKQALTCWKHFRLSWMEAWPADTPIETGQVVAIVARALGLWSANCSRIVYTVDERGPIERFGFAYGTLSDHVERGEERFMIEWNKSDDSVWYDILAFSRPRHILAWLGYPLVRRTQKRFARDSAAAMIRAARAA